MQLAHAGCTSARMQDACLFGVHTGRHPAACHWLLCALDTLPVSLSLLMICWCPGDERADIPALRALQQQISSCGVALPETALLADMLDKAEGIQHKAKQSLLMRQTLEELTELVKEAASVPVYIPDMDTVEALISKAHDWLKRAAAAGHQVGGCSMHASHAVYVTRIACSVCGVHLHSKST